MRMNLRIIRSQTRRLEMKTTEMPIDFAIR